MGVNVRLDLVFRESSSKTAVMKPFATLFLSRGVVANTGCIGANSATFRNVSGGFGVACCVLLVVELRRRGGAAVRDALCSPFFCRRNHFLVNHDTEPTPIYYKVAGYPKEE
ncbi:unnamed protein product [Ectocarpus sp. 12 AP-2014]